MDLTISRVALAQILQAASASPDREICGLLLGSGHAVDEVLPCVNVAAEPRDSFEIDPAALIGAWRAARSGGIAPIGHYHSHPDGSTRPSPRDAALAEPGSFWIIVGDGDASCWRAEASGFVSVDLRIA